MKEIAILLPTKNRTADFKIFADSWREFTEGKSVVIVGLDEGDTEYDEIKKEYPEFIYEHGSGTPLEITNRLAVKYCETYNYVSFAEDDAIFRTPWETIFINKLRELGDNGIVWGNDLLNKEMIVGLPFMNSKIVQRLGYMSPPELKWLFVDHFWVELGRHLNSLYYFPEVIYEHAHYSTGKRKKDHISEIVDEKGKADYYSYHEYKATRFMSDIAKLR